MEVGNSKKMISILQNEIEHLKEKYRLIVELKEDVNIGKKIASVREEI